MEQPKKQVRTGPKTSRSQGKEMQNPLDLSRHHPYLAHGASRGAVCNWTRVLKRPRLGRLDVLDARDN